MQSIGQSVAIIWNQGGNKLSEKNQGGIEIPDVNSDHRPNKVNLRDISINEINNLIKAGRSELLDIVPWVPTATIQSGSYSPEPIGEYRVDLIGQVVKYIEFNKSTGRDNSVLNKVLDNLLKLDGAELPPRLDVSV